MANTTKMANRYGLDIELTNIADPTDTATIDYANEVSLEISGEITWATGGQNAARLIGFKDPMEGTLTISTQIVTPQLLRLITGDKLVSEDAKTKVSFKDNALDAMKYYKITGTTVWQADDGTIVNETITAYKCLVTPNYSITYNGSGDPVSVDVAFNMIPDENKNILDIEREDGAATA